MVDYIAERMRQPAKPGSSRSRDCFDRGLHVYIAASALSLRAEAFVVGVGSSCNRLQGGSALWRTPPIAVCGSYAFSEESAAGVSLVEWMRRAIARHMRCNSRKLASAIVGQQAISNWQRRTQHVSFILLLDEAAFNRAATQLIDCSLASNRTLDCRIDISTPNGRATVSPLTPQPTHQGVSPSRVVLTLEKIRPGIAAMRVARIRLRRRAQEIDLSYDPSVEGI